MCEIIGSDGEFLLRKVVYLTGWIIQYVDCFASNKFFFPIRNVMIDFCFDTAGWTSSLHLQCSCHSNFEVEDIIGTHLVRYSCVLRRNFLYVVNTLHEQTDEPGWCTIFCLQF